MKTFEIEELIEPQEKEEVKESNEEMISEVTEHSKKGGRSFHHNSQKHTVITIKQMVSLAEVNPDTEERRIMLKMWSIFTKGNKKTKEVLSVLFGAADLGNERDLKLFEAYGFG